MVQKFIVHLIAGLVLMGLVLFPNRGDAEWSAVFDSYLFYTDDVALFSATRRLSRDEDPTQPVIDRELAEQGSDGVYEPELAVKKSFHLFDRPTEFLVRGQGFIFFENTRFNHGTLGVEASHALTNSTEFTLHYYFAPDLFVGFNEVRTPGEHGEEEIGSEVVTTNYLAPALAQRVHEDVILRLYFRYGTRRYEEPFKQRDTDFWTIGPHLTWEVSPKVDLTLGYHYERGLADGRNEAELEDDVSYFNHFVTGEATIELMEQLDMELAVHYEYQGWTTGNPDNPRNGQNENVIQGDIEFLYELTDAFELALGAQGQYRKESFESAVGTINTWFAGRARF